MKENMKEFWEINNNPFRKEVDKLLDNYRWWIDYEKEFQREATNPHLWHPYTEYTPPTFDSHRMYEVRQNLIERIADGIGSADKTERFIAIEALISMMGKE